jgi:hypothetical protein
MFIGGLALRLSRKTPPMALSPPLIERIGKGGRRGAKDVGNFPTR